MIREIKHITQSIPTMDGDGVALQRNALFDGRLDPFLMLDEIKAEPNDSPNSFPIHPHRGIQTLSYIINGSMQHKDSLGNESLIKAGDLQWMHTGQGILHSEKPGVDDKGLWGFQFWLNVPRPEKYQTPDYADIPAELSKTVQIEQAQLKILAGHWQFNHQTYQVSFQKLSGQGALTDIYWSAPSEITLQSSASSLGLFIIEGQIEINQQTTLKKGTLVQFNSGEEILLNSPKEQPSRLLIFKGEPINEPIYHRGSFVMTNAEEMEETVKAYQNGTLIVP